MATSFPLDTLPLWALFLLSVAGIAAAQELGYGLGRARGQRAAKESEALVGGMVGAQLGLLAFLLAFTFGLATSRFDARREVVLDEANAIGTAYLRAAMLPETQAAHVRTLLREYTDIRIQAAQGGAVDEAIRRSEAIQGQLWTDAAAAAASDPRSVPIGLFVEALNDVIDLHSKRITAALRTRIPTVIWSVLFGVALLSFGAMGYQAGLTRTRRSPASLVVTVTFAAVLVLVVDVDRSTQGLLRVSQQPMIDLRNSMNVP
jgi:hypothetical protein